MSIKEPRADREISCGRNTDQEKYSKLEGVLPSQLHLCALEGEVRKKLQYPGGYAKAHSNILSNN